MTTTQWLAGMAGLVILTGASYIFFKQTVDQTVQPPQMLNSSITPIVDQTIIPVEPVRMGLPIRIKISTIKVDAPIEYVGLTPEGAMAVPKKPANTAWYSLGPRPGEVGSAVIDGHFGWVNGIPAVFDKLHKLRVGDSLTVDDDAGVTMTFVVRALRTFNLRENPVGVFNSNDGLAHLNLITCEGVWNKSKQSYSDRLVVFTDRVG